MNTQKTPKKLTIVLAQLNDEKFIKDLKSKGAEIFLVGGIVRDSFLDIESKDIDLMIRKLSIETIIASLSEFGNLTETTVADKMGVIKFKPIETNLSSRFLEEDIDIALPRTETLMNAIEIEMAGITNMHNAFHINSDPNIPVEEDLQRRDFTINSIAIRLDGTIFDPFNGLGDIENKVIRHTNKKSFSDDPLRMFRAVQFASRFEDFEISRDTMQMIFNNSESAKTIAPERIHTEVLKIFEKGDIKKGIKILRDSTLMNNFINFRPSAAVESINTIGDFFFHICRTGDNFQKIFNGDNNTKNAIDAIHKANSVLQTKVIKNIVWDFGMIRMGLFEAIQTSDSVLNSKKLIGPLSIAQKEFNQGLFPKNMKELNISGKDLLDIGMKPGPEVGQKLKHSLWLVLSNTVPNDKVEILNVLNITETKNKEIHINNGTTL